MSADEPIVSKVFTSISAEARRQWSDWYDARRMLLRVNLGRCRPVLTSDEAVDRIPSFSILGMAELWAGSQFRLELKILHSPMNVVDIGSDDIWTVGVSAAVRRAAVAP
jgi:hypothetical protein